MIFEKSILIEVLRGAKHCQQVWRNFANSIRADCPGFRTRSAARNLPVWHRAGYEANLSNRRSIWKYRLKFLKVEKMNDRKIRYRFHCWLIRHFGIKSFRRLQTFKCTGDALRTDACAAEGNWGKARSGSCFCDLLVAAPFSVSYGGEYVDLASSNDHPSTLPFQWRLHHAT